MADFITHPQAPWWRAWPGPGASAAELAAWLEHAPLGAGIEGPEMEWAHRQGRETARWLVTSFRRGANSGETIRSTEPDGFWSSADLCARWQRMGMGLASMTPHLTPDDLHALLRGWV